MNNHAASLLIVDDDQTFCDVLARALTRRGFIVRQAYNSQDALQCTNEFMPEYAVIDLRIGEESGLNVVRELKEKFDDIRMVVLTGYASIATAVEAIKLGAIYYLTKPAEADDIVAALKKQQGDEKVDIPERPMSVRRLEWEHIQSVLNQHDGNISAAARALGMHRRSLQRKLQKRPARS